jgi:hypothetical protein
MLDLLARDSRAIRRHLAVFSYLLDRDHRDYGNAKASVRFIADEINVRPSLSAAKVSPATVSRAVTDLLEWGYMARRPRSGQEDSRYEINWALVCETGRIEAILGASENGQQIKTQSDQYLTGAIAPLASDGKESANFAPKTPTEITSVFHLVKRPVSLDETESVGSVSPAETLIDRLTGTGLQAGFTERRTDEDIRLPVPASGGGQAPASADPAGGGGFGALWDAYAVHLNRAAARDAFNRLAPDSATFGMMITAAAAWRAAAEGGAVARRKTLAAWLTEERFYEEPPAPFVKKDRAPKSTKPIGAVVADPVTILKVETLNPLASRPEIQVTFRRDNGQVFPHVIPMLTDEGHALMKALADAAGVNEASGAVGHRIEVRKNGRAHTYGPTAAKHAATGPAGVAEILAANVLTVDGGLDVRLVLLAGDGTRREVAMPMERSDDLDFAARDFASLVLAAGLKSLSDTDVLIGRRVRLLGDGDRFAPLETSGMAPT